MIRRITVDAEVACIVADRQHIAGLDDITSQLGGGWIHSAKIWKESGAPFVVLLCHTPERITKKAPLAFIVVNPENLGNAVAAACSQLSDCQCTWFQFLDSDARNIVDNVLALETTAGNA